ncbi:MAG: IMP cyclohydrolase, partial [Candidatus Aenigmarchaeota archaeon]|nr:IMP cyclohydrolase [Candidatus Aenigmarchaeota archaeon]
GAKELKTGKEGLSVTNTRDMDRALRILKYFRDEEACAVMKHLNPAGFAVSTRYGPREIEKCFNDAWKGDPRAAFGSVVVFTKPVNKTT